MPEWMQSLLPPAATFWLIQRELVTYVQFLAPHSTHTKFNLCTPHSTHKTFSVRSPHSTHEFFLMCTLHSTHSTQNTQCVHPALHTQNIQRVLKDRKPQTLMNNKANHEGEESGQPW